jgi:hypothetical protein
VDPGIEEPARALADGIEAALPGWVATCVERVMHAWAGGLAPDVAAAAARAGAQARTETGAAVRALLLADIDEQRTTPLALLRAAVRYPTAVLRDAGVPPIERDRFAEEAFPDDLYGLAPASFADLDPGLADPGITWGAAKAFEHRRRHRPPPDRTG